MKKKGKKLGILLVCFICLVSCQREEAGAKLGKVTPQFTPLTIRSKLQRENRRKKEKKAKKEEGYYKMFYGEWKVTKVVSKNTRFGATKGYKELIGTTIYYDKDKIKNNGKVFLKNPEYKISINPMPGGFYVEHLEAVEDLGIKGDYFVFVQVPTRQDLSENRCIGKEFFIKDDKTLILFTRECYYELKRMSWIEGAESQLVYQAR